MTSAASRPRTRGFALVIVLWMLAMLAALAMSVAATGRVETQVAATDLASARARALSEAGVHHGIVRLLNQEEPGEVRVDGTPYVAAIAGAEVSVAIQDEGGRVDLNAAPPPALAGLFAAAGLDESQADALAGAVADYRDANDERHLNGAEAGDVAQAGWPHPPKNAPFDTIAELRRVLGMTRDLYDTIAPVITVHSNRSSINPATAPRLALLAVPGVTEETIEALMEARETDFGQAAALVAGQEGAAAGAVGGPVYAIRAAASADGARYVSEGIVWITGDDDRPFWILGWRAPAADDAEAETDDEE